MQRLAILNRGEPAMRCLAAVGELARESGLPITSIAMFTEPDAASWFVREADEVVPLGPALLTDSGGNPRSAYLDVESLMAALAAARADAVWVGWGFVAESADFAERCEKEDITFVGPPSDVIRLLGNKVRAKQLAEQIGIPVVPWSGGAVHDAQAALIAADKLGYPVLVKAAAGGGGRAVRMAESAAEMPSAFASARREAEMACADPTVYIERKLHSVRHVEVQVIADGQGAVWPLGVRDCSIRLGNQKVIGESGCTLLGPSGQARLCDAAVELCRAAGYRSAGTVEFLVDTTTGRFMFLEVRPGLQAGHSVTEMATGVDLVKLQLHVACGGKLAGAAPRTSGYAIEARLDAVDPEHGFKPTPGRVTALRLPSGPGIRVDAALAEGDTIAAEFDPAIARIIAHGRDRDEALSRLRRGIAQSLVVIEGGTTNKALLVSLASHPDMGTGGYDNRWLDRLAATGDHLPALDPMALVAAAVEAAETDQAAEQASFLAAAARGRPELRDGVGQHLHLRLRGNSYPAHVCYLGAGDYRLAVDGKTLVDVNVQRLGRYERAMTCRGKRYKIVAAVQDSRLLIEVDGVPHAITRDDGGQVRCPCPAFVVAVLVAPGDAVHAGDPLVVVESMKMESTVTAPQAGVVRSVSAQVSTQVEAGTPLVWLQPPGAGSGTRAPDDEPADFGALARRDSSQSETEVHRLLRAYLLGYDIEDGDARDLSRERDRRVTSVPPGDEGLLGREQELLEIFADVAALSQRVPVDPEDEHSRSSQEDLRTYLAILDPARSGTPPNFVRQLRTVLAHYGIQSLSRTPELERALLRIYRSAGRMPAASPIVYAILDRWRRARNVLADSMTDERLSVLGRLITTTQGRYADVCGLAREAWFCFVDGPVLDRTRALAYAELESSLDQLTGQPGPEQLHAAANRIIWFPLPMRARLLDRYRDGDETAMARLLEIRTRRFYRIRDFVRMHFETFGGYLTCLADYPDPGQDQPVHLVTAYVPIAEVTSFSKALAAHLRGVDERQPVVVDLESWRDGPLLADDDMAVELDHLLAGADFGRQLHRLTIAVTSATKGVERAGVTQYFTYSQTAAGFAEDVLYRNMHPMLAERLELWRLSNFSLRRLPSAEDVYLFHAVAHQNPKDERLIALAEVRDLTAARGPSGQVIGYPLLEGILAQAFADIRRALAGQPQRQRPLRNRVVLYVRPTWDIPTATWRSLAHRLAPQAADLGLQKVVARIRMPDEITGDLREAILDVENVEDRAVSVRIRERSDQLTQPLTEYEQKALRAQRTGLPYPYELIRMLTPPVGAPADFPAGDFTEYDLSGDEGNGVVGSPGRDAASAAMGDELVPVDRPYGRNRASVVTGVITNYTALVPEGMRRVAILGDPTEGLGSLAEAECRRILAALRLARRLQVPVEWYALSSGARIAWDSGTENMDWIAAVLRGLVEFTQQGGEVNVVVTGINVGAQPYWNAEATMLMHTRGILIMTPAGAMVLTGKKSLDYSGGVSAEDNLGIGGFERVMGANGQAQYWAPTLAEACALLLQHYAHTYVVPGEKHPRRAPTSDAADRDVCASPHKHVDGSEFALVGDIFSAELNGERKKPFDMRSVMRAVTDSDHAPLERWARWLDAESAIVWEARIGGFPVCLIGLESRNVARAGTYPADGPSSWTSGTLFPQSSRKVARAINAASGNRPVVMLANLAGFDGSPESLRKWQLEYGAEIGRAVTNFRGPIVFVVVSRYHGGAFVVFSKRLHDDMETAALTGSFASVIGGAPAAAVVLARQVAARTSEDPRVAALRAQLETGEGSGDGLAEIHHRLTEVSQVVRAEKLKEVADEFDSVHDITRAQRVGSVDHIITPAELRPFVIHALERRLTR